MLLQTSRLSSSDGTPMTIAWSVWPIRPRRCGLLTELAHDGEEVALVLARNPPSRTTGIELLDHVRQLHPHAKRALLVPPDTWADQTTAEAIRGSLALGRIDYYVPSPAGSPDEVFHEAVSSFLLEWATRS